MIRKQALPPSPGRDRRLSGVFDEAQASALKHAYSLALDSLAITHAVDATVEARLADLVLKVFTTEEVAARRDEVDVAALASRSVERYLTFYNLERIGDGATLH